MHDQYEMKCLLKEQEPHEAKQSAFKKIRKVFSACCVLFYEWHMNEILRKVKWSIFTKRKKDACAYHMNEIWVKMLMKVKHYANSPSITYEWDAK